jgi:ABC-type nitrate/sulfonate/bicarbonate transport system substrate-binding protein
VLLEKDGYRIIAGPNDVKLGVPTNGLSTTNQRIAEKRGDVRKVLRAMLRGLRFVRERRDDSIAIMTQWLNQKPDIAARSYDLIVAGFSQDGAVSDTTWQALIDSRVQTIGLPRPASLDQVRDLTLLREVQKELKIH